MISLRSIFGVLLLTLCFLSCNSADPSSSEGPEADLSPPTVLSTTPAANAVDVSVDAAITARFSECIDTGSVDGTSFVLSGDVSGVIACTDSIVTFDPTEPLAYSTTYTASLTTDIIDRAGNALENTHSWSFRTERNLTPGVEWTEQTFPDGFSRELNQLAVTSGIYLVLDGQGDFIQSTNAVDWTLGSTGSSEGILTCFWADTAFFGFGDGGNILMSADGVTWEVVSAGTVPTMRCVANDGDRFIGCGANDSKIYTSADFTDWVEYADLGTGATARGIVWTGDLFVTAGGSSLGSSGSVYTSDDGLTWTTRFDEAQKGLYGVACSDNLIVCVGLNGTIISSPDGIDWTEQVSGTTETLFAVIWTGSNFVAVGNQTLVLSSIDGETWNTLYTDDYAALLDVAWIDNMYIAVGLGAVFTSP